MYNFYKILHLTGVLMVFLSYGGLIVRSAVGSSSKGVRRLGGITSGIGMILILAGGFGLLARMNYGWPGWVLVKIAVWLVLGYLLVLINRKPQMAQFLWWITLLLGMTAMMMAVLKPF